MVYHYSICVLILFLCNFKMVRKLFIDNNNKYIITCRVACGELLMSDNTTDPMLPNFFFERMKTGLLALACLY